MNKFSLWIKGKKQEYNSEKRLAEWKQKAATAYHQYEYEDFDTWEKIYLGTRDITANVNNKSTAPVKKANNIRNIVYELIESQVNTIIPSANVRSLKKGYQFAEKMIEDKINTDASFIDLTKINDKTERNTPIHGISAAIVHWNSKIDFHEYKGEKEIEWLHAKQILPQPGVYELDKMDYFFIISPVTKRTIKEKYGVDVEHESKEFFSIDSNEDTTNPDNEIVDEVTAFYKDNEGDVGKFVFVGDTVCEDLPKYYYPRISKCDNCGYEGTQTLDKCPNCESKLTGTIVDYEILNEDMMLSPISYPISSAQVVLNAKGEREIVKDTKDEIIERVLMQGTKIPVYVPKRFPVAIRINVPENFQFRGQSDVQVIKDQQEAIKKVLTKAEEKITQAGTVIMMPEGIKKPITNETYSVVSCKPEYVGLIRSIDLKSDTTNDMLFVDKEYAYAQSTLGVTDSFQGKYDPSAKSGRAKQVQVEQTAGRLGSKIANKYSFYKQLYQIMFEFDIAFTHETRPYLKQNAKNKKEYGDFNKYELLAVDKNGEWYFNSMFIVSSETADTLPSDKMFMYEQAIALYGNQALTLQQLWETLEELGFPLAAKIVDSLKDDETNDPVSQVLMALSQMTPEEKMSFLQLPVEEQMAMINTPSSAG